MTKLARKGSLKGYTAFDVAAANSRAMNAGLYLDSSNTVKAKYIEDEYTRIYKRESPQGRIDRLRAAHKAWAQQHVMAYCEADDLDDETWLNVLMRKDERAFAAVMSRLGIDLDDMEHVAWWMRLDVLDIADIYLVSQEIHRDEEAGKKKPKI